MTSLLVATKQTLQQETEQRGKVEGRGRHTQVNMLNHQYSLRSARRESIDKRVFVVQITLAITVVIICGYASNN